MVHSDTEEAKARYLWYYGMCHSNIVYLSIYDVCFQKPFIWAFDFCFLDMAFAQSTVYDK